MRDILVVIVLMAALTLSTFSLAKGLWLCGVRVKEKKFNKLWLAVSCFFTCAITAVAFVALLCWM